MRQIILDTETTGLSPQQGHRIIEIGCVEMYNRRLTGKTFHTYLQPDREVEPGAMQVHGITNEFLKDKPRFLQVVDAFKAFIKGAELIIHNAPFDVGFIENEFALLNDEAWLNLTDHCQIIDTLVLARKKHPGQRNNLDALCKRYGVGNEHREKHGALLDSEILAEVYLLMTGGQDALSLDESSQVSQAQQSVTTKIPESISEKDLVIIYANQEEKSAHQIFLDEIERKSGKKTVWREAQ